MRLVRAPAGHVGIIPSEYLMMEGILQLLNDLKWMHFFKDHKTTFKLKKEWKQYKEKMYFFVILET